MANSVDLDKTALWGAVWSESKPFAQTSLFEYLGSLQQYWAATWQNQQSDCAPSEDSDQPGHLPSLIRVFACTQWVAKGPGWSESLLGAHPFCWFCHVAAHLYNMIKFFSWYAYSSFWGLLSERIKLILLIILDFGSFWRGLGWRFWLMLEEALPE